MTIATALRRRSIVVLLTALMTALALAACGGGGEERDAEALLDRAFGVPIPSADVEIDAELQLDGLAGFEDPVRIRAAGPYIRAEGTLPKLDLDVDIDAQGAGQAIQAGLLSTGDRVFLKFGGSFFEQSRGQVASANRRLARDGERGDGSLADLGLDPRKWIVGASVEGEEEIGGVTTDHVSGTLDVDALIADLNDLVKQSAGALGTSGQTPRALGRREIERLSRSIDDPSFDVYVGKDDDVVRRVSLKLDLDVPEGDREAVNGVSSASIRFSAQLSDIGGDQRVEAPRVSSPLSDLTRQLGGLSGLIGGLGGGGASGVDPDTATPTVPDAGAPTPGGGDGSPSVDDFERYGDCLEQASPDDTDALARCRDLLP